MLSLLRLKHKAREQLQQIFSTHLHHLRNMPTFAISSKIISSQTRVLCVKRKRVAALEV
jgi:hypothetical protein